VRFLIDECLHTSLTMTANEAGQEAYHVVYRGWAGLEDHELRAIILRDEFVFVTNNGRDFSELLGQAELQPGLVIIVPNEKPAVQRKLFRAALQKIVILPSLVNKVIEIGGVGQIKIYDLPKG
jgi:predicted nuclease of predicted toxin-antitoxin system